MLPPVAEGPEAIWRPGVVPYVRPPHVTPPRELLTPVGRGTGKDKGLAGVTHPPQVPEGFTCGACVLLKGSVANMTCPILSTHFPGLQWKPVNGCSTVSEATPTLLPQPCNPYFPTFHPPSYPVVVREEPGEEERL